jgi:hypothetical protein
VQVRALHAIGDDRDRPNRQPVFAIRRLQKPATPATAPTGPSTTGIHIILLPKLAPLEPPGLHIAHHMVDAARAPRHAPPPR